MTNSRREDRARNRKHVYEYLRTHPCVMCGESDPACLEFDHIEPVLKRFTISQLVRKGAPLDLLVSEIRKCRVLCANCHRKETAQQQNWYQDLNNA